MRIASISAWQIFDSRGFPTVEAEESLTNGTRGRGLVPSGASRGQFEALELRDGDQKHYRGKSVLNAISNITTEIATALSGMSVFHQREIDERLIELDGTINKSRLGANAILAVSMAVANAAAIARREPLYAYLGRGEGILLPVPEIQIIGGGAHANWRTDVQDFLIIAVGARSIDEAMEISHNVYHAAGDLLRQRKALRGIADEGGYWPEFDRNEDGLELLVEAIVRAGYSPGRQVAIALDIAASDLYDEETHRYHLNLEDKNLGAMEFCDLIANWCARFPIVSIEDPMADTDQDGWKAIMTALGSRLQIVGDDLFTTNANRIRAGMEERLANAVLIKLNQIGTVTETLDAIQLTQSQGWQPIVSARSGETEDTFIAHLAVATNAGQLKVGSFARSERMAKWNELLRIQRDLRSKAQFNGFHSP